MAWTDILGTIMKLGGTGANLLGQPEIGIPLSVGGGVVSGSKDGMAGALTSGAKSVVGQGLSLGMGAGLDALKTPVNDSIDITSKGLTVPGRRLDPVDLGNMTAPASPKALFGGS
jgi:hypothetical protein